MLVFAKYLVSDVFQDTHNRTARARARARFIRIIKSTSFPSEISWKEINVALLGEEGGREGRKTMKEKESKMYQRSGQGTLSRFIN